MDLCPFRALFPGRPSEGMAWVYLLPLRSLRASVEALVFGYLSSSSFRRSVASSKSPSLWKRLARFNRREKREKRTDLVSGAGCWALTRSLAGSFLPELGQGTVGRSGSREKSRPRLLLRALPPAFRAGAVFPA